MIKADAVVTVLIGLAEIRSQLFRATKIVGIFRLKLIAVERKVKQNQTSNLLFVHRGELGDRVIVALQRRGVTVRDLGFAR